MTMGKCDTTALTHRSASSKTEVDMTNGSRNGGDSAQKKVTIDTRYLKKEDLQALKEHDPFLYYSIPGVRAATIQSNGSVDMLSLRRGGNIPRRATFAPRINSTPTKVEVERQSRISFECHVDLLLDDRMNEMADWPFGGDDEEEELDAMIDKLLQHGMSSRRQSRPYH